MKTIEKMNLAECLEEFVEQRQIHLYGFASTWRQELADRIHDLTQAQAEREAELIEQFRHIAEASPQKWEMSRSEFESEFVLWARNRAKHIITPPETP